MLQPYIATCPLEIQDLVAAELRTQGGTKIRSGFKAIQFEAKEENIYRMHLGLRTVSRLLKVLKTGSGSSLAIITNQASKVKWDDYLNESTSFLIEGVAGDRGPKAPSSTQISKAVRFGLEQYYQRKGLQKPRVDLKNPKAKIIAFVHEQRLTISIDTSGKTFHKRGYKLESHPAPVKETLAAAILSAAGYDGSENLYDPMCGSGTIAIEGAYISLDKAPLIHRKKGEFALENLKDFNYQLWRSVQDEVRQSKRGEAPAGIYASDISGEFVEMARSHALRARVEKHIQFKHGSFFELQPPCDPGLLVCNLPYGERLDGQGQESIKDFYQEIGNTLKRQYSGWRVALLAAEDAPYKFIGLRPSKKIPLLNGSIRCKLLIFEMYRGSRKGKEQTEA
ncbi:THUMP domain-containing class I SAM-dependent RNA methyltransferase [Pseudobacteriovorax antillogorgiicola]|uniref:Putative N6-adenine-specific DNA methylase n=1 Tax=Pseudobacteriovorax antillogorgiicola TaxID=1513793 RepID=A0A1Y6B2E5_9BACT|nr:class I SAM-dependent RNA methyltransferase [Pseudobacteriovorax antillogorgiicola]TCS59473.1 putative N6-adenine-specific DNA methylase [Pseudobacteriovorax antillogorgiicola]SME88039.1 putative N6-adenine-specific DNA methylase [Pseudobacteriovorax antillogorgiicola]